MAISFYFVLLVAIIINCVIGLQICEDHYASCPSQDCGNYPLKPLFRTQCMKTCGVCKDVNRASRKPTAQSSTDGNGYSANAVDGNANLNICSKTNRSQSDTQWWCSDLQQVYDIDTIKIYSPVIDQERLQGFKVSLGLSGKCDKAGFESSTTCYIGSKKTSQSIYTITGCNSVSKIPLFGRFVYISIPYEEKAPRPLTLCEVGIFTGTKCNVGFFSQNSSTCLPCDTCFENSCEPTTGMCWDGCKQGFKGESCSQCVDGLFGPTCRFACNTTKCQNNCDRQTGICSECDTGYYGKNCEFVCDKDCRGGKCLKSDGSCITEGKKSMVSTEAIPVQNYSENINKYLVGVIGTFIGIAVTILLVSAYRCFKERRSDTSYELPKRLPNRPPSRQELDFPMDPQYMSSCVSTTSSRYTEVNPDSGSSHGSHYLDRRNLSQYAHMTRPPAELPENEKRRLQSEMRRSKLSDPGGKYREYPNDAYDSNGSVYEAMKTEI